MDSQSHNADWRSILLLIFSLSVTLMMVLAGIATLLLLVLNESVLSNAPGMNASPLVTILTASGMIVIGILLLPVAWTSLQRLRGMDARVMNFPALRPWLWIAIPALWVLAMILASLFYDVRGAGLFVPLLHILSVGLPIYLVLRIAVNRIPLGSSQRAWGVFGVGVTVSPFLAVIAEFTVIGLGLIGLFVYLGMHPEMAFDIERIASQLENAPDLESLLVLVGPLINNPLSLISALAFLSFFVPIFEETCKSVGVWLVVDKLVSPAQGFALGVVSGAGFALAESLFASITPDSTWALTLAMRAFSGSMHMLATGLVGWGIASARLEKRYWRLVGMILLAMSLHGVWNAGAILTVAGGLRVILAMPEMDALGILFGMAGVGVLFLLMVGMFVALFLINGKLRTPPKPLPEETVL